MGRSRKRTYHLDTIEHRLTGPKRIGFFGYRNVGKTTLLAMLYRQASTGQIPGCRLASLDSGTAEYLADKIAQIESGEPPAGTMAETDLRLRLYHGPARMDLTVKDYQGEHVALGSREPIREFLAGCDAILLCLDPENALRPADRRRRQQEIEILLEQCLEQSERSHMHRPVALVLTKFDRVLAAHHSRQLGHTSRKVEIDEDDDDYDDQDDYLPQRTSRRGASVPALTPGEVERLVESQYGMTAHALATHAKRSAVFAVSSYGFGATADGRPPHHLNPIGLEGPLTWLADQLESSDRDQLDWLWDLAPDDLSRLGRCLKAYQRRYPESPHAQTFRRKLKRQRRVRLQRRVLMTMGLGGLAVGGLAGYDLAGYRLAVRHETNHSAPEIALRWTEMRSWHPTLGMFFPRMEADARARSARWAVAAAEQKVQLGTASENVKQELAALKDTAPELADAIAKVEAADDLRRHDDAWKRLAADAAIPGEDIRKLRDRVVEFLRTHPDSANREQATSLLVSLSEKIARETTDRDRKRIENLALASRMPKADLQDVLRQARAFLDQNPESDVRRELEVFVADVAARIDDRDIEAARDYSRKYPTNFATRLERYQDYLKTHASGGKFLSEAMDAKSTILEEWDVHAYRLAYDHLVSHPDDITEVSRLLREYLRDHGDGRFAKSAREFVAWWDKVHQPQTYKLTLRRGDFDEAMTKYLSGGGPDLSVIVEVAGVRYGPSPIVKNSSKPIWDWTMPKPVVWKLGDPVSVQVTDHDWWDSPVDNYRSKPNDSLALRALSGTIKCDNGARLTFATDFRVPELPKPE
jgi:GTPase SAR1 family protein